MDELRNEIQNLVQQFQAIGAAMAAAPPGGGAAGAGAAAAAAGAFALTPAQVAPDNIIDYSTSEGKKLWNSATAALDDKFDADAKNINIFTEQVMKRATNAGWTTGNGNIISIPDVNGNNRNLIQEYGRLTMEEIRTYVQTYSAPAAAGAAAPENRRRQNDYQFYVFLSDSLGQEGQLKVLAEAESYTIGNTPSGSLFFKLLMQKAIVDTRATASHLRENLTNLDSYISTVDSNIQLFNQYVKVNKEGLKARGESTDDLMINLFKGYGNAGDREFVQYIKLKKDQYDEGADIDADKLMQLALNKYENLIAEDKWKAMSPEQEQLVALNAEFEKLKDENLKLSRSIKKKNKKDAPKKAEKKSKKGNKNKQRQNADMEWKKKPPRDGESHTKTVSNKTYYWCPAHMAWTIHKPAECRLNQERDSNQSNNNGNSHEGNPRRNALNQAMTAIMNNLDSDEEEE